MKKKMEYIVKYVQRYFIKIIFTYPKDNISYNIAETYVPLIIRCASQ